MLAQHGFDVYGLEISATAVATAQAYSVQQMDASSAYNFSLGRHEPADAAGQVNFLQGDFFQRDWERAVNLEGHAKFDLIYDYTVRRDSLTKPRISFSNILSFYVRSCQRRGKVGQLACAIYLNQMGCLCVSSFRSTRIPNSQGRRGA